MKINGSYIDFESAKDYKINSPLEYAAIKDISRQFVYILMDIGDITWTKIGGKRYIVMTEKSKQYTKGIDRHKRGRPSAIRKETQS